MYEQLSGLVASPRPIHLFVDLSKNEETGQIYGWHVFDGNAKKAINIAKPAVCGILESITMRIKEFQNKQNYKIEFNIRSTDRLWIIRSGVETFFTRGIILSLIKLDNLRAFPELTFLAEPGDTTVRGSVWVRGAQVWADWDADVQLFPLIQKVQTTLGQEPQTIQSIKADFDQQKARQN